MATAKPSEFRLIPARADLNAVAVPQGRNLQIGTAIFKYKFLRAFLIILRRSNYLFHLSAKLPIIGNLNSAP